VTGRKAGRHRDDIFVIASSKIVFQYCFSFFWWCYLFFHTHVFRIVILFASVNILVTVSAFTFEFIYFLLFLSMFERPRRFRLLFVVSISLAAGLEGAESLLADFSCWLLDSNFRGGSRAGRGVKVISAHGLQREHLAECLMYTNDLLSKQANGHSSFSLSLGPLEICLSSFASFILCCIHVKFHTFVVSWILSRAFVEINILFM